MSNLNDKTNREPIGGFTPRLGCIPCLARQANEAVVAATPDAQLREAALRQVLQFLACMDWHLSPPALAQQIHRLIRNMTHNPDPYLAMKKRLNQLATQLDAPWHHRFTETFPPFEAAVRLAIVGNLLDAGAKTQLGEDEMLVAFEQALAAPLVGSVAELADAIDKARSILYLADNAGEIVFDRWLLAQLPLGKFTVVVRGAPVLNDATLADAEEAEMGDFCDLISNGSDAPGTLLHDCSPEFRDRFAASDLILAKGQGNYESLVGADKHIFFLFKVKCVVVSEALGCPCGSLVILHQRPTHSKPQTTTTTIKVAIPEISPALSSPRKSPRMTTLFAQ